MEENMEDYTVRKVCCCCGLGWPEHRPCPLTRKLTEDLARLLEECKNGSR
jgi:hypothetical protein